MSVPLLVQDGLLQQQVQGIANTEAGGVRRDVGESTLVAAGGQVHVDPVDLVIDKAVQKAAGKDVVGFAFQGALQGVGNAGLQCFVKVLVQRERPDAFAAVRITSYNVCYKKLLRTGRP